MIRTAWMLLVLATIGCAAVAHAADKELKPQQDWSGSFPDDKDKPLKKLAPDHVYLADAAAWEKLWKAWRPNDAVPKLDFDKQLVLIGTTDCAANKLGGAPQLSDDGDLKIAFFSTLIGGPGFAYKILVVDRTGVKSVNGKKISP